MVTVRGQKLGVAAHVSAPVVPVVISRCSRQPAARHLPPHTCLTNSSTLDSSTTSCTVSFHVVPLDAIDQHWCRVPTGSFISTVVDPIHLQLAMVERLLLLYLKQQHFSQSLYSLTCNQTHKLYTWRVRVIGWTPSVNGSDNSASQKQVAVGPIAFDGERRRRRSWVY